MTDSLSQPEQRLSEPHLYIEVEDQDAEPMIARIYDLADPAEPCVFGPAPYAHCKEWFLAAGGRREDL